MRSNYYRILTHPCSQNNMKTILTIAISLFAQFAMTQEISPNDQIFAKEAINEEQIMAQIKHLFDGMRNVDTTGFSELVVENATLQSVFIDKNDSTQVKGSAMRDFVDAVAKPRDQKWDEHIHSYEIKIDGPLAVAWTDYTFYLGDTLLHCGVNVFHFAKMDGVWKILSITDTRRKSNCQE